jgi:tetratricopeptide (TPR) repeat protein/peptidoglycan/LPS O-acetylase OafA/YrhL
MDGLRATMMLLGLVLHSAISYGAINYGSAWPFQDISTNPLLDWLVFFIHVFRMPIFYAMAGFFAAMLYERRGAGGFARHRAGRILVPFVVGWVVLFPLISTGFNFANVAKASSSREGLEVVAGMLLTGAVYADSTAHLWFLYYLLMFYAAALVAVPLLRRLPPRWSSAPLNGFGRLVRSRGRALWFAIPTALTLCMMSWGGLETSTSFIPDPRVFLAYSVFFVFGWLLYLRRDLLPGLTCQARAQAVLGVLLTLVNMAAVGRMLASPGRETAAFVVIIVTGALMVWLLLFGITGLFLRYLDRQVPLVRYIVDASYWLYLIHLPFTIWIPGLMSKLEWPALFKALIVFALGGPVWLASYHFLVRGSFIGAVLNGRRYPLGLPRPGRAGAAAGLVLVAWASTGVIAPAPAQEPDKPPPADCLREVRRARIAWSAGRSEEALQILRDAAERRPGEILPLLTLLTYSRNLGVTEKEQAAILELLRKRVLNPEAAMPFSTFLVAINDEAASEVELEPILRRLERELARAERPDARLLRAAAALQARLGDTEGARRTVARLLHVDPTSEVLWAAVSLDVRAERWDDAIVNLTRLKKAGGTRGLFARLMLVTAYGKTGRHRDVVREANEFRTAESGLLGVQITQELASALLEAGWALRDRGLHEEAKQTFATVLEFDEENEEAAAALHQLYGSLEQRLGFARRERQRLDSESDPYVLLDEGARMLAASDTQRAFEVLQRAAGELPDEELPWFNLGLAALKLERWEDAAGALGRALELNPARPESLLNRGIALEKLGRCEEVVRSFEALLRIDPEMHQAHYFLYTCYKKLGQSDKAVEALSRYNAWREGR